MNRDPIRLLVFGVIMNTTAIVVLSIGLVLAGSR